MSIFLQRLTASTYSATHIHTCTDEGHTIFHLRPIFIYIPHQKLLCVSIIIVSTAIRVVYCAGKDLHLTCLGAASRLSTTFTRVYLFRHRTNIWDKDLHLTWERSPNTAKSFWLPSALLTLHTASTYSATHICFILYNIFQ